MPPLMLRLNATPESMCPALRMQEAVRHQYEWRACARTMTARPRVPGALAVAATGFCPSTTSGPPSYAGALLCYDARLGTWRGHYFVMREPEPAHAGKPWRDRLR